uniref:Rad21_Rec8 domain-containing protein n=1 Tax=Caenorhabditis tropicalis TaxID=1561998 RepID=A0A1I7TPP3_9PELO
MADDEDDIVWIREDTEGSPTTPATIIEVAPVLSDAFEPRGPPEVTISAPPPTPPALALITIDKYALLKSGHVAIQKSSLERAFKLLYCQVHVQIPVFALNL